MLINIDITIVTICFNDIDGLKKTISSIKNQNNSYNYEHIIIDGGSSDGSREYIQKYCNKYNLNSTYVSEPDKGIYDAFNKGINLSNGEWIIFLNSGDRFYDTGSLEILFRRIKEINNNTNLIIFSSIFDDRRLLKPERNKIFKGGLNFSHQACLTKKKILACEFSLDFKIAADYELYCRQLSSVRFEIFKDILIISETGGLSEIKVYDAYIECFRINKKYNMDKPLYYLIKNSTYRTCLNVIKLILGRNKYIKLQNVYRNRLH